MVSLFLEYLLLMENELMCLPGEAARGDRASSCDVV